jgi:hypothetical protein
MALFLMVFEPLPLQARSPIGTKRSTPIPFFETVLPLARSATNSLFLQWPGLDSLPLAQILVQARQHGVKVEVIVDQANRHWPVSNFLQAHGVAIFVDEKDKLPQHMTLIADSKVLSSKSWLPYFGRERQRTTALKQWQFHRAHSRLLASPNGLLH